MLFYAVCEGPEVAAEVRTPGMLVRRSRIKNLDCETNFRGFTEEVSVRESLEGWMTATRAAACPGRSLSPQDSWFTCSGMERDAADVPNCLYSLQALCKPVLCSCQVIPGSGTS